MTIPDVIMHNGQQMYFFDRIENGQVYYVAQNCWGGPGCDEVKTIYPSGPPVWEVPQEEYRPPVVGVPDTPEVPRRAEVPEPGTFALTLAVMALALWGRR